MDDCTHCEEVLHKEDAPQMFAEWMNRFWIVCFVTRQHFSFLNRLWSLLRIPSPLPWNQSSCWSNASSYSHGYWQLHTAFQVLENKSLPTSWWYFIFLHHDCHSWWVTKTGLQINKALIKKVGLKSSWTHSHDGSPAPFASQEMCRYLLFFKDEIIVYLYF